MEARQGCMQVLPCSSLGLLAPILKTRFRRQQNRIKGSFQKKVCCQELGLFLTNKGLAAYSVLLWSVWRQTGLPTAIRANRVLSAFTPLLKNHATSLSKTFRRSAWFRNCSMYARLSDLSKSIVCWTITQRPRNSRTSFGLNSPVQQQHASQNERWTISLFLLTFCGFITHPSRKLWMTSGTSCLNARLLSVDAWIDRYDRRLKRSSNSKQNSHSHSHSSSSSNRYTVPILNLRRHRKTSNDHQKRSAEGYKVRAVTQIKTSLLNDTAVSWTSETYTAKVGSSPYMQKVRAYQTQYQYDCHSSYFRVENRL